MTQAPHHFAKLVPNRIRAVLKRMLKEIWISGETVPVEVGPYNETPVPRDRRDDEAYMSLEPGTYLGTGWGQRWMRMRIPARNETEMPRWLELNCQGEGTLYVDGKAYDGHNPPHPRHLLPDAAHTLHIDLGLFQTFTFWDGMEKNKPHPTLGCCFNDARIVYRDENAWQAYNDLDTLHQLIQYLWKEQEGLSIPQGAGHIEDPHMVRPLLRRLLVLCDRACQTYEIDGLQAVAQFLPLVYKELRAGPWQGVLHVFGHAHLDLVWLWPESATTKKGINTFATALRLMERYEDMTFLQSMPALYEAVFAAAPELEEQVRSRIAEGRWFAEGSMEVEADTLVPSGEALARCVTLGRERLARLGGDKQGVCFLPDVFGYSACLPQILRLAGVERFFTSKIAWGEYNRFPHSSFRWRSPDGSEVLTHLLVPSYNGMATVEDTCETVTTNQQIGLVEDSMLPIGYGDGGGGPSEYQLERIRRFADLAEVPRTQFSSPGALFEKLEEALPALPVFEGELYLELHRKTYTTQGRFKQAYRNLEKAVQAREAARVCAGMGPMEDELPWKRLCFAQFHDALPGSSIGIVYQQLTPELVDLCTGETAGAVADLGGEGSTPINTVPWPRRAVATVAGEERVLEFPGPGPGVPVEAEAVQAHAEAGGAILRNDRIECRFDGAGRLHGVSMDGIDRRIAGTGLIAYSDNPVDFDAWDLERYTLDNGIPAHGSVPLELVENSDVRAVLQGSSQICEKSSLTARYIIEAGCPWLMVELDLDWHEDKTLLKYHVLSGWRGERVRCGSPFGSVTRRQVPGHNRDESQFEIPFSRWMVLGDDALGPGLALITEAKYGASVADGNIGLTLVASPEYPDPEADRGKHTIRFAIGPCDGTPEGVAAVAAEADMRWAPILGVDHIGQGPLTLDFPGSLAPSAVVPHPEGGYVLRLHEVAGAHGEARMRLMQQGVSASLVDLRGQVLKDLELGRENGLKLPYGPYQVRSVWIR